MANLTITVDEEVLRNARIRALQQGTSVNAVLAERLRRYAGQEERQGEATRKLLALTSQVNPAPTTARERLSRGKLHER